MAHGRLLASWRLTGTGDERLVEVQMFPGSRMLAADDLPDQATALGSALAVTVTDVRVTMTEQR